MNLCDVVRLKGCTLKGRSLETSSGCSALDTLFGGGVPVSAFCVVDELNSRAYFGSIVKYFLAEGLYSGHDVLIVDPVGGDRLWKEIPARIVTQPNTSSSDIRGMTSHHDDLSIAFRYAAKPKMNSLIGEGNRYDLSKSLDDVESFCSQRVHFDGPYCYDSLYQYIVSLCKSDRYNRERGPTKNLLRIAINHLGSPVWKDSEKFSPFLVRIHSLLKKAYVVLLASVSSDTMFKRHTDELFATADLYFQLVAVSDEEEKKLSGVERCHGFLRILRLPRLTSLGTHNPPVDLTFTQKRTSLEISIMHLPPVLGDEDRSSKTPCAADF
uniref:Elongator complex protein 4 n=1 Tax=Angiostrongylus cantonensis TaxID=6313 RepID=A0A0K0CTJ3_ANGCA